MVYLLVALTFLTSILIYSFFPRSDTITILDKPTAKIAVTELVAQHGAAKEAASVISTDASGNKKMAYETWEGSLIPSNTFTSFLPPGFTRTGSVYSMLVCIDNATGQTGACAGRTAETTAATPTYGSTDFIITYTYVSTLTNEYGRYLANLSPRALGEMVYLTPYSEEQHLQTNCGILREGITSTGKDFDPNNAVYELDNTRYNTVRIPKAFTNSIQNYLNNGQEALVCITRLSVAYDKVTCQSKTTESNCNAANAKSGCVWDAKHNQCQAGIIYPQVIKTTP